MYDVAALHAFFAQGSLTISGVVTEKKDRGAYHWRQYPAERSIVRNHYGL